jgi:hypothetical protein
MNRNSIILRILAVLTLAAALLSATASQAAEAGTLMLDGKLDVEQGGLDGATVTVFQDSVETQRLSQGLRHFVLELDLGHIYRIAFAKPGCVTKELLLDAHTPDDLASSYFSFLFQVTLKARKGEYAYDTPVAVIHFDTEEQGFGYDRTHATPKLVRATQDKAEPRSSVRRQVHPFTDPTTALAAWVEEKRSAQ